MGGQENNGRMHLIHASLTINSARSGRGRGLQVVLAGRGYSSKVTKVRKSFSNVNKKFLNKKGVFHEQCKSSKPIWCRRKESR